MSKSALDNLSDKQRAFVLHYLDNGFNATRAALSAGYAKTSARQTASENLTKPDIRAAVDDLLEKRGLTPKKVLAAVAQIAFGGDVAELEDFLKGTSSLQDLRTDGFDTKLIKSVSITIGRTRPRCLNAWNNACPPISGITRSLSTSVISRLRKSSETSKVCRSRISSASRPLAAPSTR